MYRDLSAPVTFSGGQPSGEVVEAAGLLPAGSRFIDIGCGDGRNALYLAAQGHQVTAIDISPVAIAKVQQFAAERGLKIAASVQDIAHYVFNTEYDGIVSTGVLHMFERECWQSLLKSLRAHTTPGGYHAIGVLTDALPAPEDQKEHFIGLFKAGELFDLYSEWQIISRRSFQFHDEHPNGARHHHAGDNLLARKI